LIAADRHNGASRGAWAALSLLTLIGVWSAIAAFSHSEHLPSPREVFVRLGEGIASGVLPYHVGMTLMRVAAAFVLAMLLGAGIGIAMARRRLVNLFFDSWLILLLHIPALVTIVLSYIWIGFHEGTAVLAVVINKLPNTAVTMREGARALDRAYEEMAAVYGFGPWKTFRHVVMPQLAPFFVASARSGLALVWKIVLVVELLGRSNGVGFMIYTYFSGYDVAGILAYSLAFITVILAIEYSVLQPWEAAVSRWRR
jgi:NitT/TauT family transport system permease protein